MPKPYGQGARPSTFSDLITERRSFQAVGRARDDKSQLIGSLLDRFSSLKIVVDL